MAGPKTAAARRFGDVSPPLSDTTMAALAGLGFDTMTPVQAATIPLFLTNKDVAVEACTGSGKTVAYVIPVVERLLGLSDLAMTRHGAVTGVVRAVIVSPTRELARQIHGVVSLFTVGTPLTSVLLTGGTEVASDVTRCVERGCHIVVATPGRLLDIMTRDAGSHRAHYSVSFSSVELLILDEADTLLDMGFADTLTRILAGLPKQRRTGLFSATQTKEVAALARAGMRNPVMVQVKIQMAALGAAGGAGGGGLPPAPAPMEDDGGEGDDDDDDEDEEEEEEEEGGKDGMVGADAGSTPLSATAKALAQSVAGGTSSTPAGLVNYYHVCEDAFDKLLTLCAFIRRRADGGDKAIAFVLTCASVDYYATIFNDPTFRAAACLPPASSFPILPLHGQMPPAKRGKNYAAFVAAKQGLLLCTDVAARGIDVPDVDWIVQFDPPKEPAFFIHRVGRTARAGRAGCSLLLLLPKEARYLDLLAVKQVPMTVLEADALAVSPGANGEAVRHAMLVCAAGDRDVLLKSTKGFISFMRGYGEHVCRYVFKTEHLDVAALAAAFGLIKLPKLDELRGKEIDYVGLPHVSTGSVAFKDPDREAARQAALAANRDKIEAELKARDERRARALQQAAADFVGDDGRTSATGGVGGKRKRVHKSFTAKLLEDWELLGEEERLEKRFRKGKLDKSEYSRELSRLLQQEAQAAGTNVAPAHDLFDSLLAKETRDMATRTGDAGRGHEEGEGEGDEGAAAPVAAAAAGKGEACATVGDASAGEDGEDEAWARLTAPRTSSKKGKEAGRRRGAGGVRHPAAATGTHALPASTDAADSAPVPTSAAHRTPSTAPVVGGMPRSGSLGAMMAAGGGSRMMMGGGSAHLLRMQAGMYRGKLHTRGRR